MRTARSARSARSTFALAALVATVVAGAHCKRSNGAYCDNARPCPNGFACDLTARECHTITVGGGDMAGAVVDMAGCACSGTTPICAAMSCVSCLSTSDPDGECAAVSPSTPWCEPSGPDAGSCVGCRTPTDCATATPFCDMTTHVCRGCIADLECPSLVCELTPGSVNHGLCVPIAQVEYVDGSAATNGNGLLPTTPRQKIQDAVMHATGADNRPFVHIAAGSYNENITVNNSAAIYLVGAAGAIIHPSNNDAVGAQNGASITLRNLIVTATSGNGGNCQTGATFIAYRSQFLGSSQNGVYSSSCRLLLDADWIDSNSGAGVYIGAGDFTVINSIITRNTNNGGFYQLGSNGPGASFVNNTVSDNVASGLVGGVSCSVTSSLTVRNSIIYNNKNMSGANVAGTNCQMEFCADDDTAAGPQSTVDLTNKTPGFKGGTPVTAASYHLTSTSPCLSEASPMYAPNHDFDFELRPDATSGKPDIGADELQ